MLYKKEFLQENFEESAEGKSPEEFLKDKCKVLLDIWIEQRHNGYELYKYTGPYWEVIKDILQKNCPELFREFERLEGPFNEIEIVKKNFSYGNDLLNFMAALQYSEDRQQAMHVPDESHLIEIDGKDVQYLPNIGIVEEEKD